MTFNMIKEKTADMQNPMFRNYSKSVLDIINKMLVKNPAKRITPSVALNHKFFRLNGFGQEL